MTEGKCSKLQSHSNDKALTVLQALGKIGKEELSVIEKYINQPCSLCI